MHIQLIRNATMRWHYREHVFLTDPYFAAKGTWPPLAGKARNPQIDLPVPPAAILDGVDAVLLSHLHPDHFDPVARELLPKDVPVFCQPCDEPSLCESGFRRVFNVNRSLNWRGVTLVRTPGLHGRGVWAERMGTACGFVLEAADEPTVYWAGDTIWYEAVEKTLAAYRPTVVITHSSGAAFEGSRPIIMDAADTISLCRAAPNAHVVAVHMDTFDFDTVSRAALRAAADAAGVPRERLRIPHDGETLTFGPASVSSQAG